MDEHRIPTTVLDMKMNVKNPGVRSQTLWLKQVKRDKEK
jgi:hypothetical protein